MELKLEPSQQPYLAGVREMRRPLLELCVGYGLILATIWSPRPVQHWLYWIAVAFVLLTAWASFPGWAAMGFRRGGFAASMWVVLAALIVSVAAIIVSRDLNTLRHPISARGWVMTFGGYTVWSFVQQYLLQGYFLFRFLRLVPRREWAALAAAIIFAAAHLPNPILTPITLIWGIVACFVFLRCRNVYPLAMAHAILGITVAITVPGPVVHNMRVGLGYLRYHAPHQQAPGLEPSPARQ
jgi:membrane protease YdiL (CAAX protease family)